jgi:hypothetical protein
MADTSTVTTTTNGVAPTPAPSPVSAEVMQRAAKPPSFGSLVSVNPRTVPINGNEFFVCQHSGLLIDTRAYLVSVGKNGEKKRYGAFESFESAVAYLHYLVRKGLVTKEKADAIEAETLKHVGLTKWAKLPSDTPSVQPSAKEYFKTFKRESIRPDNDLRLPPPPKTEKSDDKERVLPWCVQNLATGDKTTTQNMFDIVTKRFPPATDATRFATYSFDLTVQPHANRLFVAEKPASGVDAVFFPPGQYQAGNCLDSTPYMVTREGRKRGRSAAPSDPAGAAATGGGRARSRSRSRSQSQGKKGKSKKTKTEEVSAPAAVEAPAAPKPKTGTGGVKVRVKVGKKVQGATAPSISEPVPEPMAVAAY